MLNIVYGGFIVIIFCKRMFVIISVMLLAMPAFAYKSQYKMSIVVGPKGPWGEAATKFSNLVRVRTDGRINIKPYFAGQLFAGNQTNEFLLLREGVADFALGSTINWSTIIKPLNLFSLPFFFKNYQEVDAVTGGRTGKKLFRILRRKGVVGIGWGENGFRALTNSKRPIKVPSDLKGLKIRVVGSPIFIDIFRALGANPVSMNWADAVPAFRQKVVDGEENPVNVVIIPYKVYNFQPYITIWHYAIDPLILGINRADWKSFSKKDKRILKRTAREVMAWEKIRARNGLEGSTKALSYLKSKGMKVTVLTESERKLFKQKAAPVMLKWTKIVGKNIVRSAEKDIAKQER